MVNENVMGSRLMVLFTKRADNGKLEKDLIKYIFSTHQTKFIETFIPGIFSVNPEDDEDNCLGMLDFESWRSSIFDMLNKMHDDDYHQMNDGKYRVNINRDTTYLFLDYLLRMCQHYITTVKNEPDDEPEFTICCFYYVGEDEEDGDKSIDDKDLIIKTFDVSEWKNEDGNFKVPEKVDFKRVVKTFAESLKKYADKL